MDLKPTEQYNDNSISSAELYQFTLAERLDLCNYSSSNSQFSWTILSRKMDGESPFSVLPDTNLNGSFLHMWTLSYMWEALHTWKSTGGWKKNWGLVIPSL